LYHISRNKFYRHSFKKGGDQETSRTEQQQYKSKEVRLYRATYTNLIPQSRQRTGAELSLRGQQRHN